MENEDILAALHEVLSARKQADPKESYVAKLYHKGLTSILKKIGEEATETVIAATQGNREQIIYETADLWFHTLIMLNYLDITHEEVLAELARRFGISGLTEKAARSSE